MSVRIKLKRMGKRHQPFYRIIVIDRRKATATGDYLDNLGTYNPMTKPAGLTVNAEKTKKWISQGAQPTVKVAKLLKLANAL